MLKPNLYADHDANVLKGLFRIIETGTVTDIERLLAAEETAPYLALLENRYLTFVRARLRKPDAMLKDMPKSKPSDDLLNASARLEWRFEPSLCEAAQLFSLIVDVCGSLVGQVVDVDAYIAIQTKSLEDTNDLDNDREAFFQLTWWLDERVPLKTFSDTWFGKLLYGVTRNTIESIRFDQCDCSVVNDSPVFTEFLLFVQGFMENDLLHWDFFQSTPPKFPSSIYALQYSWIFLCDENVFAIPSPLNPSFNNESRWCLTIEPNRDSC